MRELAETSIEEVEVVGSRNIRKTDSEKDVSRGAVYSMMAAKGSKMTIVAELMSGDNTKAPMKDVEPLLMRKSREPQERMRFARVSNRDCTWNIRSRMTPIRQVGDLTKAKGSFSKGWRRSRRTNKKCSLRGP